jgi:hypothetical protein
MIRLSKNKPIYDQALAIKSRTRRPSMSIGNGFVTICMRGFKQPSPITADFDTPNRSAAARADMPPVKTAPTTR